MCFYIRSPSVYDLARFRRRIIRILYTGLGHSAKRDIDTIEITSLRPRLHGGFPARAEFQLG